VGEIEVGRNGKGPAQSGLSAAKVSTGLYTSERGGVSGLFETVTLSKRRNRRKSRRLDGPPIKDSPPDEKGKRVRRREGKNRRIRKRVTVLLPKVSVWSKRTRAGKPDDQIKKDYFFGEGESTYLKVSALGR